jgi:hypothetical protein
MVDHIWSRRATNATQGVPQNEESTREYHAVRGTQGWDCGTRLLANEILPEFHRFNAELLGVSVDGVWCHLAFAENQFETLMNALEVASTRSATIRP